ncbi:MAG: anti-sigma factor family protein [Geminicoccaceae bacterium]
MNAHCEIDEDELHALVDGRLREARCAAVLAHLAHHPEHMQRVIRYAEQRLELRRQLHEVELEGDDPTTLRLQQALTARLARPDYRGWVRWVATIVLLFGAGWWGRAAYQHYGELPPLLTKAAQAHQLFGDDREHPVELTNASQAEMTAWFSQHLGAPVPIPSLEALGLRLIGGRLLVNAQGPVAQLIYEDAAGRRLSLCLAKEPEETGREIRVIKVHGLIGGYWDEGDLAYALVAETSEQQVVSVATELGASRPAGVL